MSLVLRSDAADGVGAVELQGVALCLVRGAGLVEVRLAVPLHPDVHPAAWAPALEAVLDHPFEPHPVARVVVAEGLLDRRAVLEFLVGVGLWRCWWWEGR